MFAVPIGIPNRLSALAEGWRSPALGYCPRMGIRGAVRGTCWGSWNVGRRSIWRVPAGMPAITPGRSGEATALMSRQQCPRALESDPASGSYATSRLYHHLTLDGAERAVTRTAGTRPFPVRYMSVTHGPALRWPTATMDLSSTSRGPATDLPSCLRRSDIISLQPAAEPATSGSSPRMAHRPEQADLQTAPFGTKKPVTQSRVTGSDLGFYCGRCWVRTNEGLADGFTVLTLTPTITPLSCRNAADHPPRAATRPICLLRSAFGLSAPDPPNCTRLCGLPRSPRFCPDNLVRRKNRYVCLAGPIRVPHEAIEDSIRLAVSWSRRTGGWCGRLFP